MYSNITSAEGKALGSYSGIRDRNRLGRMLMKVRSRIRNETDPTSSRRLIKREIQLLLDLDDPGTAVSRCREIISEDPGWIQACSILADIHCRSGEWTMAEKLFQEAAEKHSLAGDPQRARRIRTGVLYRLAEARGDLDRCLQLADPGCELGRILSARVVRLKGDRAELTGSCQDQLSRRILALESAWQDGDVPSLLDRAIHWASGEPEWRWRFIVESIDIFRRKGLNTRGWREAVGGTTIPVLDPRFDHEWSELSEFRK